MEIRVALSGALRHLIWCPTSLPSPFACSCNFFLFPSSILPVFSPVLRPATHRCMSVRTGQLGRDHGQTQRGRPAVGCVSMFFDQTRTSPPPRLQVEQNLLR